MSLLLPEGFGECKRLLSKVRAGVRLRVTASWSPALLGVKEFLKLASVSNDSASNDGH